MSGFTSSSSSNRGAAAAAATVAVVGGGGGGGSNASQLSPIIVRLAKECNVKDPGNLISLLSGNLHLSADAESAFLIKLVVIVFISATFLDTKFEQDAILERAVPALQEFCSELGLQFQVVLCAGAYWHDL